MAKIGYLNSVLSLKYAYGDVALYQPGDVLEPRKLHDFELVWIMEGRCIYHAEGCDYPAQAGAVVLGKPGAYERYTWDREVMTRHAYIHFDIAQWPCDWPSVADWPAVVMPPAGDVLRPMIRELLARWCRHRQAQTHATPPPSVHRLMAAALESRLHYATADDPASPYNDPAVHTYSPPVERALQWINTTLSQQSDATINLAQIARQAHVTPVHLCRLFQRELNISPMKLVRLRRLERSIVWLERSNLTMTQIADRLGFENPYHYSRCFHQAFGLAPTAARKRLQRGEPTPIPTLHPLPASEPVDW